MKIETTDLNFMGTEHVIASFLLLGDDSAALVETGPTTCLGSLMGGLKDRSVSPEDVRQVFLTHIHLDHSGPLATSRDCSRTLPSTCTRSATRTWWTLRSS